jgi:hypothetical protein
MHVADLLEGWVVSRLAARGGGELYTNPAKTQERRVDHGEAEKRPDG